MGTKCNMYLVVMYLFSYKRLNFITKHESRMAVKYCVMEENIKLLRLMLGKSSSD